MNTRYKYQLARHGKHTCPNPKCKRKTFVLYIDTATGEPLHSTCGKCDRAIKCGYHYPPKQYFKDNNISFDKTEWKRAAKIQPKPQPAAVQPSFIDAEIMRRSLKGYERNTLLNYLCSILDKDKVMRAVERYRIGTTKTGATVYYQIDEADRVRTGKAIIYKPDGHRDHSTPPTWVHRALKYPDYQLEQCLFGLHLLKDSTAPIGIVEAEKTALIASIYLPDYVWLATGGKQNFKLIEKSADRLKGRAIILFPDLQAADDWQAKADDLKRRSLFLDISVSDMLERIATEQEREQGLDLADYLLRQPTRSQQPAQVEAKHAETVIDATEQITPKIAPKTPKMTNYQQEAIDTMTATFPNGDGEALAALVHRFDLQLVSVCKPDAPPLPKS